MCSCKRQAPSHSISILNGLMGLLTHNGCSKCSDEILVSVDVESGKTEWLYINQGLQCQSNQSARPESPIWHHFWVIQLWKVPAGVRAVRANSILNHLLALWRLHTFSMSLQFASLTLVIVPALNLVLQNEWMTATNYQSQGSKTTVFLIQ